MSSNENITGIIGSGLGGLAAACTLAARGHRVVVLEKNPWLGGKAAVLEENGFRFDMGPTILTIPSVLRRVFAESGRRVEDYLELIELDPQWRCFFEDGSVLDLVKDTVAMAGNIEALTGGTDDAVGYREFLELSERLNDISQRYFFYRPVGGLRDMFEWKTAFDVRVLKDVLAMRMGGTVSSTLRGFISDKRVAQMVDHFTQYVGSSPEGSPAVLCGIAHMQTDEGIWYPKGGTRAVPLALEKLARELGVEFRTNAWVEEIELRDGVARGVRLRGGERIALNAVVSNCDSVRTFRDLIGGDEAARFERRRNYEPACSGVVLYLGLNRRYPHLQHHNFVFSRDPHEEFATIYGDGEPAEDPTCYVCASSGTEPGVAPAGGEALYVLVHTPYLRKHHDWTKMLPAYRDKIISKLKRTGGMEDIEERIVSESVLTPQDIHERYNVLNGAIYGLASHGRFFGAFKPNNRDRAVRNLYLCGGAAHPGPGMPMVMMSGWIAADALDKDLPGERRSGATTPHDEPVIAAN